MVNVVDCQPTQTGFGDAAASDDDRECGDFGPGRFAWKRGEFRLFGRPIPYRGKQGIFNVPDGLIATGRPAFYCCHPGMPQLSITDDLALDEPIRGF
jgi:hypothetical protein